MKTAILTIALAALTVFTVSAQAEVIPTFSPPEFLYWGAGQIIQTENTGVIPNVGDWNGDGLKDILVGIYQSGKIYFYPNTGTNLQPVFATRSILQADGRDITLTSG